ncbi:TetR/AcrR family transcriptional regulator [Streptomyces sp. SP18BB07]|uniref:TetR/AcrR family transcriptional regulator n=1 Tax=Streptomyces sp. SP18BB07 TaxID=3002522 RepID=UPI002E78735B|nr:TetR family transcriptional regulator [Streptomyces sp. SP18BB07]MEE1766591.1 TetR family transcriptional regulator [Streptomyces sp. SP18BB07]
MRVTKAQAEQNRAHIVATAARLFRERGYDGVGVAELMAAAGFTHGGFYKHFRSKADLMAEASASGLSQIAARAEGRGPAEFVESYVSRGHRDGRGDGCAIAALSGDAARQSADIKGEFAAGIENLLTALQAPSGTPGDADQDQGAARAMLIDMLAHSIGAIVLSRACPDDSPLADEILDVSRKEILASLAHGSGDQSAALSPEA